MKVRSSKPTETAEPPQRTPAELDADILAFSHSMGTKASNEPIAEAGTGSAAAKGLHDQLSDARTALEALSGKISDREQVIEAAVRAVTGARAEEKKHLADYQRHLLAGEKAAADTALAAVSKARERTAAAIASVQAHRGAGAELKAERDCVYADLLRLAPLMEEAQNEIRRDRLILSNLLDISQHCASNIRERIDAVVAQFVEGGAV